MNDSFTSMIENFYIYTLLKEQVDVKWNILSNLILDILHFQTEKKMGRTKNRSYYVCS